jgi:hypothetical protein
VAVPKLTVLVDGVALPEESARAFWGRFSSHMEEHKGDLAGFAKAEGFASVHPKVGPEGPVLVASRTEAQGSYANAGPLRSTRGSGPIHKARAARPSPPPPSQPPRRKS